MEVMSKRRLFARVSRVSVEVRVMAAVSARGVGWGEGG